MITSAHDTATNHLRSQLALHGGTILVIGGRSTNFPPELRNRPQFVFWDSTESNLRADVPHNCRGILFTRFIPHAVYNRVMKTARERRLTVFPVLNTGEIKRMLEQIAPTETAIAAGNNGHPETAVAADTAKLLTKDETLHKPRRGELQRFIEAHVTEKPVSIAATARQLLTMAEQAGLKTTVDSLAQGIRMHLRTPAVNPRKSAAPSPSRPTETDDVLATLAGTEQLLAEATKALDAARAAYDLVAESLPLLRTAVERHQARVRALREALLNS